MPFWDGLEIDRRTPVYQQLAAHVRRKIAAGELGEGDRLPSRREVAMRLQINPNTVQKAFRMMEDEGLIATDSNQGSVVACDAQGREHIAEALAREAATRYVKAVRGAGFGFKRAVELISDAWPE